MWRALGLAGGSQDGPGTVLQAGGSCSVRPPACGMHFSCHLLAALSCRCALQCAANSIIKASQPPTGSIVLPPLNLPPHQCTPPYCARSIDQAPTHICTPTKPQTHRKEERMR